ncbi:MAG TPA: MopE-related protein, partial [Myxococcota bacterium]|nr:MopE-related protein [Myxococcota bacterium]
MILVLLACRTHFEPPDPKDTSNWRDSEVIDSKETDVPDDSEDSKDSKESKESKEDTGPFDVDGDGYPLSQDCNDHDPQAYPGAPEVWYDGKDADCDNHDDFDQDYDGHARSPEGDDCSDLDPSIHPGADDIWYDGVDSDCAGNDDYDQDADGYSTLDGDCDDLNATVYETAEERLGDGVDQ